MPAIDLHVHTNASDGAYAPAEIVRMAAEARVDVLAITDHDTVDGIGQAIESAIAYVGLQVIPGVELSTYTSSEEGEVHILGYFVDYKDSRLHVRLIKMRDARVERARLMVERLQELGYPIELSRVRELAGEGTIGRPHVAMTLLEKGYIKTFNEAFDRFIAKGGPAYFETEKITPIDAVKLILEYGGIPILAHPFTATDPERSVREFKKAGLVGIEAYYNDYQAEKIGYLLGIAKRYDLLTTGGTDYHGLDKSTEGAIGEAYVPRSCAERLLAYAAKRGIRTAYL